MAMAKVGKKTPPGPTKTPSQRKGLIVEGDTKSDLTRISFEMRKEMGEGIQRLGQKADFNAQVVQNLSIDIAELSYNCLLQK